MHKAIGIGVLITLASCVPAPRAPAPPPAPRATPPRPVAALPALPPRLDWRDVPLTPGRWLWRRDGDGSLSQYGVPGAAPVFTMRCDPARRVVAFSRSGRLGGAAGGLTVTTSFGAFAVAARDGDGPVPAIVGELPARDPRLDQLAFSRGRFLVDTPGQARLVVPSWPEAARVIEDCRG